MFIFQTLKTLLDLLEKRESVHLVTFLLFSVFAGFLEIFSLALLFTYIAVIAEHTNGIRTQIIFDIYQTAFGEITTRNFAINAGILLIAFFCFKNIFSISIDYLFRNFLSLQQKKLTRRIFEHLLYASYDQVKSGAHNKTSDTIASIAKSFNKSFVPALQASSCVIIILMIIALLAFLNIDLTILLAALFGVMALFVSNRSHNIRIQANQKALEGKVSLDNLAIDASRGFLDIRLNGAVNFFTTAVDRAVTKIIKGRLKQATQWQIPYSLNEILLTSALVTAVLYFTLSGQDLNAMMPVMAVFAFAGMRITRLISRTAQLQQKINQNQHELDLMKSAISAMRTQNQPEHQNKIQSDDNSMRFDQEIKIKNIQFTYTKTEEDIINDVSLTIPKEKFIGILGPSGSGKSTLLLILCGLLKPVSGEVLCDQTPISTNLEQWHKKIGFIQSTPYISPRTIRENIVFGRDDGNDQEKINHALKQAQIHAFVTNLPQGLDTILSAMGNEVSDGEKQRLCIARALYDNPEILIMDEATSALDKETEANIMNSLHKLSDKKTIICVSHRLSALQNADLIYSFKDGNIVSSGQFKDFQKKTSFESR